MSLIVDIEKKLDKFTLRVSFETRGGVMGLLGASGCGKSMTLKCIAGIEKPDRGRIILDGVTLFDSQRHINLPPQERGIGYLFQSYALFPNMTVRQNILCGLRKEKDSRERQRIYGEMVALMRLGGLEQRRPAQLSGGEQQRAALARIFAGEPKLLMLDEPFSALDSHLRGQMQVAMRGIFDRFGREVIMVTHSRTEAYRLCANIALMDKGAIIASKETKELFADPETRQAALLTGCKNITDAEKTGEFEVFAPAWGVSLKTALPVRDGLCAVAIRAHYFSPKEAENRAAVRFTGELEEPFEYILQFRLENQDDSSPDLWWRLPKDIRPQTPAPELGVPPDCVLPLYG